jgi:tetratricopeptide (TPR) repeat protein
VRAGEDTLRHAIATATDSKARGRLRVELAELLRARDLAAARAELDQAARECGPTPSWTAAALSLAQALPPRERLTWLNDLTVTRGEARTVPAPLVSALAEAQLAAEHLQDAAATWLALARDERVPLHHRRAAAKRAARASRRIGPSELGAATGLLADLGVDRRDRRRRPRKEAGVPTPAPATPSGGTVAAVRRPSSSGPMSAVAPRRPRRPRAEPPPLFDRALEEVRGGRARRGRRLAEQAIRTAAAGPDLAGRVAAFETALREAGSVEDALLIRRAHIETLDGAAARPALLALAADADVAGLPRLGVSWRADAGVPAVAPPEPEARASAPADHYRAAQRLLARDAEPKRVLEHLRAALSGHAGADAALTLAESLVQRLDGAKPTPASIARQRLELLRAAHTAERTPARRARLARRLAEVLEGEGDALGAVAVLEGLLEETQRQPIRDVNGVTSLQPTLPARHVEWARADRARLLRALGRTRELATALERDASALIGDARLQALAELASLLDRAGDPERALEVRRVALAEFPGAPALLSDARRHLEATGRAAESLALARAALESTGAPERRRELLREVAQLTERLGSGVNAAVAADAWLAVLDSNPDDTQAAAAAERFLVATGDWERCADLLACGAARATRLEERRPFLWRLAELRRARLGQADEATRLYVELAAPGQAALPPPVDPPALTALVRRDPALAVETARAAAAPTVADRSRALSDRARSLAERKRLEDARRDVLTALENDPRNGDALRLLDVLYAEPVDAARLVTELGRRSAKLPPADAAPIFQARGRAAARAGDPGAAREAYRRAMALDPTLAEPIAELARLAAKDGDWSEVAALLASEAALTTSQARKGALLVELAVVHGDRLGDPNRAVALLDEAATHLPQEPRLLDLGARFRLAAGQWQAAAEALDQLAARGETVADAAERYYAVGAAAEAAGEGDRALMLYSRSYARDATFRPTLERLSVICFERGQWDNTWKATEALLNRHGDALEPGHRAVVLSRSALADLHIGQRATAAAKLATVVTRGGSYSPEVGIRDVAESWAAMHLDPRLLVGMETRRRERALARARESLALADAQTARPPPIPGSEATSRGDQRAAVVAARRLALEMVGALAMAEGLWDEALAALEALAADTGFEPARRAQFILAAGDVVARQKGDPGAADPYQARARALWPSAARFGRPPEIGD